jgi:hypothetical protein
MNNGLKQFTNQFSLELDWQLWTQLRGQFDHKIKMQLVDFFKVRNGYKFDIYLIESFR